MFKTNDPPPAHNDPPVTE